MSLNKSNSIMVEQLRQNSSFVKRNASNLKKNASTVGSFAKAPAFEFKKQTIIEENESPKETSSHAPKNAFFIPESDEKTVHQQAPQQVQEEDYFNPKSLKDNIIDQDDEIFSRNSKSSSQQNLQPLANEVLGMASMDFHTASQQLFQPLQTLSQPEFQPLETGFQPQFQPQQGELQPQLFQNNQSLTFDETTCAIENAEFADQLGDFQDIVVDAFQALKKRVNLLNVDSDDIFKSSTLLFDDIFNLQLNIQEYIETQREKKMNRRIKYLQYEHDYLQEKIDVVEQVLISGQIIKPGMLNQLYQDNIVWTNEESEDDEEVRVQEKSNYSVGEYGFSDVESDIELDDVDDIIKKFGKRVK